MFKPLPDISYYDFYSPEATDIMIITDEENVDDTTETFRIMVPSTHSVYSCTWSHAIFDWSYDSTRGNIKIDNSEIDVYELHSGSCGEGWAIWEGDILIVQQYLDLYHEILLYHNGTLGDDFSYVGIVLIYSVQE